MKPTTCISRIGPILKREVVSEEIKTYRGTPAVKVRVRVDYLVKPCQRVNQAGAILKYNELITYDPVDNTFNVFRNEGTREASYYEPVDKFDDTGAIFIAHAVLTEMHDADSYGKVRYKQSLIQSFTLATLKAISVTDDMIDRFHTNDLVKQATQGDIRPYPW